MLAGLGAAFPLPSRSAETPARMNDRLAGDITKVHDPCIIREGDTYYVFTTTLAPRGSPAGPQIPWRSSPDLLHWTLGGYVFPKVPDWAVASIPGIRDLWAPDITYFDGRYHLYFACSTGGSNRSAIGLATNVTLNPNRPDYRWEDCGLVLESHESDDFNAIDPAHIIDREGHHWLAFGSFWSGLKIVELEPKSGNPPLGPLQLHSIASRPVPESAPDSIEAPFLFERDGYYYLLASYDWCCKGRNSTYYTVIGRSKSILGPYVGKDGRSMLEGYGSIVLRADFRDRDRWRGPGHCAVLRDRGQDYIVYHAYDNENQGMPTLRIAPLVWSQDGWPNAIV